MMAERFANNPIFSPTTTRPCIDGFEVTGVLNPGAFEFAGKVHLLLRVAEWPRQDRQDVLKIPMLDLSVKPARMETMAFRRDDPAWDFSDRRLIRSKDIIYITNFSYLRLATSDDGGKTFTMEDRPLLWPEDKYETFGIEDPRVVEIDGEYLITYSAISRHGVTSNLITTRDWQHFARKGVLFVPDNKDICIFPEKIGGRYACLHRPSQSMLGKPDIWMAFSDDLIHWGGHECIMQTRPGKWDSARIGCGPSPIKTPHGWLNLYHGSDNQNYYMGAALHDLEDPRKIIARSSRPYLSPEMDYEKVGFYDNVVFSNGIVRRGDEILMYYGAADACTAGCRLSVDDLLKDLQEDVR
jgi:predicted GH43/DUF377 family glycosyl hydrolase